MAKMSVISLTSWLILITTFKVNLWPWLLIGRLCIAKILNISEYILYNSSFETVALNDGDSVQRYIFLLILLKLLLNVPPIDDDSSSSIGVIISWWVIISNQNCELIKIQHDYSTIFQLRNSVVHLPSPWMYRYIHVLCNLSALHKVLSW